MNKNILNFVKNIMARGMHIVGIIIIIESLHGILMLGADQHVIQLYAIMKNIIIGICGISIGCFIRHRVVIK